MTELRNKVCELGGDTLYGFKDGKVGEYSIVIATVALRKPGSHPQLGETAPAASAPAPTGCNPPCSPGFACSATQCIPLCNPACSPGHNCNMNRTCEPEQPPAAASSAAPATP
jgi:hypothetical protein